MLKAKKGLFFCTQSKAASWVGAARVSEACRGNRAVNFQRPIITRHVAKVFEKKWGDCSPERVTWRPFYPTFSLTHLILDHHNYYFPYSLVMWPWIRSSLLMLLDLEKRSVKQVIRPINFGPVIFVSDHLRYWVNICCFFIRLLFFKIKICKMSLIYFMFLSL